MSKTSRLIQLVDLSRLKQISFSGSSPDNQDFILGDAPDGSSQLPGMDGSDGYRRRRALLARENTAGRLDGGMQGNRDNRPKRKRDGDLLNQGVDSNRITHDSDGNSSDFSSRSTSDDVELYRVNSKDGLTDDEEAGLTKKDRQRRRRRRRKNTLMDQRVVTNIKASKQDRSLADMSVLRASLINALLIASWYFFSLSISIVGSDLIIVWY